jgi:hypothetical protein
VGSELYVCNTFVPQSATFFRGKSRQLLSPLTSQSNKMDKASNTLAFITHQLFPHSIYSSRGVVTIQQYTVDAVAEIPSPLLTFCCQLLWMPHVI